MLKLKEFYPVRSVYVHLGTKMMEVTQLVKKLKWYAKKGSMQSKQLNLV